MFRKLISFSISRPKVIVYFTAALVLLALVQFPRIKVDTDPENMLADDAPVRVFSREVKQEFALYDFIVLGIVNDNHKNGVFNVSTLKKVAQITDEIKKIDGVIEYEIVAPSTKDNVEQAGLGSVRFNWLMEEPPVTQEQALEIRRQAQSHPMFKDSVVSSNGKAVALYVPIEKKDISYEVSQEIKQIAAKFPGDEKFYVTGLPVAEDQFGAEMFKQMAISAPLAGLIIFLLMLVFFKSVTLIIAPMLVAIATVVITMGLLIAFGFPVHIMSSMIPIFLMPIAVLDSVHILSEFFDKYKDFHDPRKTVNHVVKELFSPMLFTSLTSAVGFFSLSFSPIPPVQVFGVFVAVGVLVAWILTITFIPAFIMLLKKNKFEKLAKSGKENHSRVLDAVLLFIRNIIFKKFKFVLAFTVLLVIVSLYGISKIQVNDNPVRWFSKNHPIRVADKVLNEHFSGTYEAYLVLEAENKDDEIFLEPSMLKYVENLQAEVDKSKYVGKTTSLSDIVKKIYYELLGGDEKNNVIPDSRAAVAQSLISFENSHKPDDLWHLTNPAYSKLNIWFQLKSGDNKDMSKVIDLVDEYISENPAPLPIKYEWSGKTYINVIWQNNMVTGMLKNFAGSFFIVLFMMLFLFRSPVKALISMIPLTVTILFIYSFLGFVGKDYDMPVAVLSALTLGLSIDFAIHFIQRALEIYREKGSWETTSKEMFSGPGRAIIRNALVVAIGFLPLLAAPLIPYRTVGFFMFSIMAVSSLATLFILPSIFSLLPDSIFKKSEKGVGCHCSHCALISLFVASAVAYVLFGYSTAGWKPITYITIGIIVISSISCYFLSKREICLIKED